MATRPFPTNARLTAIALAFRNPDIALIADLVLPRTPVAYEFKWLSYDLAQGYTVPDTRVGRKSAPNEIDFQATEVQDKCQDFGLDDLVPNEDIEADNQGVDPLGTATGFLSNLVDLGREQMAEACRRYLALGSVQLPSYGDGATTVDLPPWAYRDGYGEYFEIGESA